MTSVAENNSGDFFLEYDRGTGRAAAYGFKLATYYRRHDRAAAGLEFNGFPTLLFKTNAVDGQGARHPGGRATAARSADAPRAILLTSTATARSHAHGILGDIWIRPGVSKPSRSPRPQYWLKGRLPRGLDGIHG
jgi:hypothetical protein